MVVQAWSRKKKVMGRGNGVFKYGRAILRGSMERLEQQRAQVALNNLRQGDMSCEEYLKVAGDMYRRNGRTR